jgi:hypothetical protein
MAWVGERASPQEARWRIGRRVLDMNSALADAYKNVPRDALQVAGINLESAFACMRVAQESLDF